MTSNDATTDRPLVLTLGCAEAARELRTLGYTISTARNLQQLLEPKEELHARILLIHRSCFDLDSSRTTVEGLRRAWPLVDVIIWAPKATASFVRQVLQAGARDVLLTNATRTVASSVERILEEQQLLPRAMRLGAEDELDSTFEGMVSRNARMWDLFDTASRVAPTEAAILVLGETGTGKELLARAIHQRSQRAGRFVAVNCAAVAEDLIDSELFGHVAGAFTGAIRDNEGLMRYASGGTLMLDEIGNIKLAGQHRLLRSLQEGTVRPVGSHREEPIDVRIIAATSVRLEEEVLSGRFREDLFYRLDVIRLEIPPLRERPEDIVYLFAHFARKFATQYAVERPHLASGFLDALVSYDWPGNVRQLENVTERLLLTSPNRKLNAAMLRKVLPFKNSSRLEPGRSAPTPPLDTRKPLREALAPHVERLERAYLEASLRQTSGRIGEAATLAGVSRRTLLRMMKRYAIDKSQYKASDERVRGEGL